MKKIYVCLNSKFISAEIRIRNRCIKVKNTHKKEMTPAKKSSHDNLSTAKIRNN